jgi:hypothetical protein
VGDVRPETLLSQLAEDTADVLVLDAGFHPVSGPLVDARTHPGASAPTVRVVVVADEVDER